MVRLLVVMVLLIPACQSRAAGRQLAPIGSACDDDAACGTGRFAVCADDHPHGYCVADCRSDAECPDAAVCVGATALARGACHLRCVVGQQCRVAEGYVCSAAGSDASHDYCDAPGPRSLLRRIRSRAWR